LWLINQSELGAERWYRERTKADQAAEEEDGGRVERKMLWRLVGDKSTPAFGSMGAV